MLVGDGDGDDGISNSDGSGSAVVYLRLMVAMMTLLI